MPEQKENEKIQPLSRWQKIKNACRSKKAWLLLVFFLLLLGVGGFVPVGKLPLLRNLAYAMGYTPDETQKISFLRALFSWSDHEKMMRGEIPNPDELSIFGEGGGFLTAAGARAQNKLINLRAVNASLVRQGRPRDLAGASYSVAPVNAGEKPKPSDISINNTDISAATQANAAQKADVFFGTDVSAVGRKKTDGYDSVGTLQKIKNPHIAGVSSIDRLGILIDKATRSDAGLTNIAKDVDKGGILAKLGGVKEQGDSRAKRDMYYAWLMGRTARRTPNPVLKKTLAGAGFNGAELPKSVFTASGFSGVGINPDDIIADMDSVTKYLELDKECQKAMKEIGDNVVTQKQNLFNQIKRLHFPSNCQEALSSSYGGDLDGIKATCEKIRKAYTHTLGSKCSIGGTAGRCEDTDSLKGHFTSFLAYCRDEKDKCALLLDTAAKQACLKAVNSTKDCSPSCGTAGISQTQQEIFNVDENGNPVRNPDDPRDEGGFLPHLDWSGSFWVGDVD